MIAQGYNELFIANIDEQIKNETLSPVYFPTILLLIPTVDQHYEVTSDWIDYGYRICKYYKQNISEYGIDDIAMFSGLGYWSYAIKIFSDYTGMLQKFSSSLQLLLYKQLEKKSQSLLKKESVELNDYDIIVGVSGVVHYLISVCNYKGDFKYTIKYLSSLFKIDAEGNIKIHIQQKDQVLDEEKIMFVDGHVNFGLSHGMVGPLVALSDLYTIEKNPQILEKIKKGVLCYKKYTITVKGCSLWPGQLDNNIFKNNHNITEVTTFDYRPSWCYGCLGIFNALSIIARNIDDINLKNTFNFNPKIIQESLFTDAIKDLSLCHGWSGILFFNTIYNFEDEDIKKIRNRIEKEALEISENEFSIFKKIYLSDVQQSIGSMQDLSILDGGLGIFFAIDKILYNTTDIDSLMLLK